MKTLKTIWVRYGAGEAWDKAIDETILNLNKEDKEVLKYLGKLLGKTDTTGQINEIDLTSSFIDKQIEEAEMEMKKNGKMYKTLGIVTGVLIIIILM